MAGEDKKTLTISAGLYAKLAAMADKAGAESVDELVSRVVRDWITKESAPKTKAQPGIAPEDEKVVEERLRALGYM